MPPEAASAGRGEAAEDARQAVFEALPPDEKALFLEVFVRELDRAEGVDAAWDAAWRAVEDPHVAGASDPSRAAREELDLREPTFPEIRRRKRFDLEWHVRRARAGGAGLVEALRHAYAEIEDPGRRETDPQVQVATPGEDFLRARSRDRPEP